MPLILVIVTLKQESVYEFSAFLGYIVSFGSCWIKE